MGSAVVFEVSVGVGLWRMAGVLEGGVGSVTSFDPDGRQVLLFGWIDGIPGVWRSIGGTDSVVGDERVVATDGLECLADLGDGSFEREVVTRLGPRVCRWRLETTKGGG